MRRVGIISLALSGFLLVRPATAADALDLRVEDILGRMTMAEKVGQLNLVSYGPDFDPEMVRQGRVGAVMGFNDAAPVAEVLKLARGSRLGIPLLVGLDVVHGFRTLFPIPLAEAATFDPGMARLASEWAANEATAAGINWNFGPMADVSHDIRWGRIVEGAGEDVYLAKAFTVARIEGFRAGGLGTATKHFAGYGAVTGGRDYDAISVGESEFRDRYLPPFRSAVDAGTESIMGAFVARDGVPAMADRSLLTGILREEWGFRGFVVSDYAGIDELMAHGVASTPVEAVRKAILAGLDMEMTGGLYDRYLAKEVEAGNIPLAVVDESVRRVLRAKVKLGLFERPDPDPAAAERAALTSEARQAARTVARESLVLLQNRGGTLPIGPGVRKVAVIGSLADSARDQMGAHEARGHVKDAVTVLEGLKAHAGREGASVAFAAGCDLYCTDKDGFAEALEVAKASDVVIAVVGEPRDLTGEGGTRAHVGLPGHQGDLVRELAATGKPVVLVLLAGRPLDLAGLTDVVPSILMAWHPGTEGGTALAEVLFGDEGPSGKLPHSWPRTVGQVPIFYDHLPSGRPASGVNRFTRRYIDEEVTPLFPFGWGLGYTEFTYSDLEVVDPHVGAGEDVEVRVTLTNVGSRPGKEAAQLYVRDLVASRSRPIRELKGLTKVSLAPGEGKRLTFVIPSKELGFHDGEGTYIIEPGRFQVWAGGSSVATLTGYFELTDVSGKEALAQPSEAPISKGHEIR